MRINHLVHLLFFVQNSPHPKTKPTLRFMWPLSTFLILSSKFPYSVYKAAVPPRHSARETYTAV